MIKTNRHIWEKSFIYALLHSLPQLLNKLIDNNLGESLERLQLVDISINLLQEFKIYENSEFTNIKVERSYDVANFLILSGDLSLDGQKVLSLDIKYFVRGQRKYHKFPGLLPEINNNQYLGKIDEDNIKQFLAAFAPNNDFFAGIIGQFSMYLAISKALEHAQIAKLSISKISLSFIAALKLGQDLSLGLKLGPKELELLFYAENEPVLLVVAK